MLRIVVVYISWLKDTSSRLSLSGYTSRPHHTKLPEDHRGEYLQPYADASTDITEAGTKHLTA